MKSLETHAKKREASRLVERLRGVWKSFEQLKKSLEKLRKALKTQTHLEEPGEASEDFKKFRNG